MKISLSLFLLIILLFNHSIASDDIMGNSYANYAETTCNGIDPKTPLEEQTPGMKFISENEFKNSGEAIRASRKVNLNLTEKDLCFFDKRLPPKPVKKIQLNSGPSCNDPNSQECTGGTGVTELARSGKEYFKSIGALVNENTDKMKLLEKAQKEGRVFGWGDLQYAFHDGTPAGVYAQQISKTSKILKNMLKCQKANPKANDKTCNITTLTESDDSKYLSSKNPESPSFVLKDKLSTKSNFGIGALLKYYTRPPGENTVSPHQKHLSSGGGNDQEDAPVK